MNFLEKHKFELELLERNLAIYKESIREISEEIIRHGVSRFPVFIASDQEVSLGRLVIDKEELALEYSIYASTLEEFVARNIVKSDKLESFKKAYKNPQQFVCIFALLGDDAGFVFSPYEED